MNNFGYNDIKNVCAEIKNCYKTPIRENAAAGITIAGIAAGAFFTAANNSTSSLVPVAAFLVNTAMIVTTLEAAYLTGAYCASSFKVLYNKYTP